MIKLFPALILSCQAFYGFAQKKGAEEIQVERAVINWASQTFEYYEGPRFEKYKKIPSKEQFKVETQIEDLKDYKAEMIQEYNKGNIKKTKEEFDKNIKSIDFKIDSLNKINDKLSKSIDNKNEHEIDFWANIKVNNGLTVYFRHAVTLNNNYEVIKAEITGTIGKESDDLKILYKTKEAEEKYWKKSAPKAPVEKENKTNPNNSSEKTNNTSTTNNNGNKINTTTPKTQKKQKAKPKY